MSFSSSFACPPPSHFLLLTVLLVLYYLLEQQKLAERTDGQTGRNATHFRYFSVVLVKKNIPNKKLPTPSNLDR